MTVKSRRSSPDAYGLFRYVEEQVFRYNYRKDMTDSDRFSLAVSQILGKRLTYAEVTGKVGKRYSNATHQQRGPRKAGEPEPAYSEHIKPKPRRFPPEAPELPPELSPEERAFWAEYFRGKSV